MSDLYTDEEASVIHEFAWKVHDDPRGRLSLTVARSVLDRIAPAIAARAAAEALEDFAMNATEGDYGYGGWHEASAKSVIREAREWAERLRRGVKA